MFVRLLTSAAAAAVIFAGVSTVSFAQNSTDTSTMSGQTSSQQMNSGDQSTQKQSRKSSKSSSAMKGHSTMSHNTSSTMNKQTAQGHKLDNIADKLNACASRPAEERQSCMDQAARM